MKAIFTGVGGHGLFTEDDVPQVAYTRLSTVGGTITVHTSTEVIPVEGGPRPTVAAGKARPVLGLYALTDLAGRQHYLMDVGGQHCYIPASAVYFVPNDGPNPAPVQPAAANYAVKVTIGGRVKEWTETLP